VRSGCGLALGGGLRGPRPRAPCPHSSLLDSAHLSITCHQRCDRLMSLLKWRYYELKNVSRRDDVLLCRARAPGVLQRYFAVCGLRDVVLSSDRRQRERESTREFYWTYVSEPAQTRTRPGPKKLKRRGRRRSEALEQRGMRKRIIRAIFDRSRHAGARAVRLPPWPRA
jgi:hypothetical protein